MEIEQRFMRLKDILKIFPISKTAWYNGCKSGLYPKPIKAGGRINIWDSKDIEDLFKRLESKK